MDSERGLACPHLSQDLSWVLGKPHSGGAWEASPFLKQKERTDEALVLSLLPYSPVSLEWVPAASSWHDTLPVTNPSGTGK